MRSLLLTGSTGFLGSILKKELDQHFSVTTLGLSSSNNYSIDLGRQTPHFTSGFDCVVHNAGKAHTVPQTAEQKAVFYALNHNGTLRLLEALEATGHLPQCFVFISTIAVYGLDEGENIAESTPLQVQTPYAKSKLAAEQAIEEWGAQRGVPVVILRLPLVVGPNPPGNLGKMAFAIYKGRYVRIRHNLARKSAVSATDVARLIPRLIGKSGVYNLTDGVHPTFESVESAIASALQRPLPWSLPKEILRLTAGMGDYLPGFPLNTLMLRKLTASLTFSDTKAREELGWSPNPVLPVLSNPNNWTTLLQ